LTPNRLPAILFTMFLKLEPRTPTLQPVTSKLDQPHAFVRADDGELFTINPDGSYSMEKMKRDFPNHLHSAYPLSHMRRLTSDGSFAELLEPRTPTLQSVSPSPDFAPATLTSDPPPILDTPTAVPQIEKPDSGFVMDEDLRVHFRCPATAIDENSIVGTEERAPSFGDDCPRCKRARLSELADRLSCIECGASFPLPLDFTVHIGKTLHPLPDFPDFVFDSNGTPYRTRRAQRGRPSRLGEQPPARTIGNTRYFVLPATGKRRITITDSRIRKLLSGEIEDATEMFTIDTFPNVYFTPDGLAYFRDTRKPVAYTESESINGWPIRRYRLRNHKGSSVSVTDQSIRRIYSGKSTANGAVGPEGTRWLGPDYPDFYVDETGQPFCVARPKRGILFDPQPVSSTPTGSYVIRDIHGNRRTLSPESLLKIADSVPQNR